MDEPNPDQIVASAARFLIDGGEAVAANVLLSCQIEIASIEWCESWQESHWEVTLVGPRVAFDILTDENNST